MEKQKILVVDDDKNIAELISLDPTKEGFETRDRSMTGRRLPQAVEDLSAGSASCWI